MGMNAGETLEPIWDGNLAHLCRSTLPGQKSTGPSAAILSAPTNSSVSFVGMDTLSDLAHECEQGKELLSEAMSLRQWEDRLASAWSDWDVKVEKFLRDEWQREALED